MDISKYCYSITFNRLRPCNDLMMNTLVDSLVYCGSGLSFYSRHAKNHFTIAAFFYNTAQFKPFKRCFVWYIWAFSICFAKVYVCVHYPIQVFIGGLIGFYFGNIVAKTYLCVVNTENEVKG
jgi:undecaprenyl-diphosphatase